METQDSVDVPLDGCTCRYCKKIDEADTKFESTEDHIMDLNEEIPSMSIFSISSDFSRSSPVFGLDQRVPLILPPLPLPSPSVVAGKILISKLLN